MLLWLETCCIDRFFAKRSWACLLCDGARWGISGDEFTDVNDGLRWSSADDADRRIERFEREWKREDVALCGVDGSDMSVNVVSLEWCDAAELSESSAELRDDDEETELEAFRCARIIETSGALYDRTFVVDRRATGPEIVRISTGLSELLTLPARRGSFVDMADSVRLLRRVNALVMDMVPLEKESFDIVACLSDDGVLAANWLRLIATARENRPLQW
jgi:hypothetical protein